VLRNTSAERLVDPQKQSKMCQRCHVQKAVAKVRVGGASEVLKLCNSCLEAMKKPGTTAVVSDVAAASSVMQDGVKKEGMMLVGVSHKQYLVVISDGTLSWYESKKSLEATNSRGARRHRVRLVRRAAVCAIGRHRV
jgi:hypothetical protein